MEKEKSFKRKRANKIPHPDYRVKMSSERGISDEL